ncbi:MAG: glycosyltransferase family 4 protein, partial [Pseudomonadota bacterium]
MSCEIKRYQFELTELLESHGHTVIPFAAQNPKNFHHALSKYFPQGVDFDNPKLSDIARFLYSWPARKAIERLIHDQKIDLVHLNIYYGQLTSSILSPLKSRGIPIIQTLHEYKIVCPVYTLLSHDKLCLDCKGGKFW